MSVESLLIVFLEQLYLLFQVYLKLSTSGPWLLDNSSDNSFYTSVRNLVRSTRSRPIYGKMMFFPLPEHGANSAHWNIQKFRILFVTHAISMFCNSKVAKVLRKIFAFTHHDMFLVGPKDLPRYICAVFNRTDR